MSLLLLVQQLKPIESISSILSPNFLLSASHILHVNNLKKSRTEAVMCSLLLS
jgi:hypothetical protein